MFYKKFSNYKLHAVITEQIRLSRHCTCGASFTIRIEPHEKAKASKLIAIFLQEHEGEGHKPCTPAVASKARTMAVNKEEDER